MTSIEEWIVSKARMRYRDEPFVYPYNLGLKNNIKQVLWNSSGDGCSWPVIKGCHQYSLTVEQIEQKQLKMRNAIVYRIVSPYNGRFFPLFSQGCRVCLSFPINDDPRLVLNVGDEVLVTHQQKRWLYGQKMEENRKVLCKGWFPAQCSVQLITAENHQANEQPSASGDIKKDL